MHSIVFPSVVTASKKQRALDLVVLDDIACVCQQLDSQITSNLYYAFEYLSECVKDGERFAVGPSLYHWLSNVRSLSNDTLLQQHLARLPSLIAEQVLGAIQPGKHLTITFSDPLARLPQGEWNFPIPIVTLKLEMSHLTGITTLGKTFNIDADVPRQNLNLRRDRPSQIPGSRIHIHSTGDVLKEYLLELSTVASIPIQRQENLKIRSKGDPVIEILKKKLADGIELLRKTGEERYEEIETLLKGIVLLTGQRFVGGSDIAYHGIAFLNLDPDWSVYTFADHLVHEGAHILLHMANELTPFLQNPDFYGAPSPIRKDPRPLYGIFHSTYVFMRLVMLFKHFYTDSTVDEVCFRLHRHLLGFYEGMQILNKYAIFTPEGEELFDGMICVHDWFQRTLPVPSPNYYLRIGKDYVV
ncbi:MAG TPA: HEXXH motif-containing putative peptide modification protein [Leptolyngbyaceae cyanobacterium]